ncbi:hypothetical protein EIN_226660 [Entamoeba invadens IP1]|uniref:SGNH hydrolase-type esterase domain-containing protein n=1 Tax=Entamoeba invadens IP1 TaxID=370355 RepID=A0A0A1U8H4_ENTIV|nr:hypothetical protein EIN_226660 [Entamoeba invadens IP1]ELP88283.1 hypothetical protein EIN_226660 [Entamoeba invadens IP1]|eukprot:XP_004255054.1 hypothetical protein EIN_226660 [Entamoeba invadens IP1]
MEVTYQQSTTLDIPVDLCFENILFNCRYTKTEKSMSFDWPSSSFEFNCPQGTLVLYFKSQGVNLIKIKTKELLVITRTEPIHPVPEELINNTLAFENSFITITLTNRTDRLVRISLIKITEARDGALSFFGSNIKLPPIERTKQKTMEIIGDSMMCGYGIFPVEGCTSVPYQSDSTSTFAAQLADKFELSTRTIAYSGIGLVRSYKEIEFPNEKFNLPILWSRECAGGDTSVYDHKEWIPDYVLLSFGMNDFWDVVANVVDESLVPPAYIKPKAIKREKEVHFYEKETKVITPLPRVDSAIEKKEVRKQVEQWTHEGHEKTIIDFFVSNDESDLDEVFAEHCILFLEKLLSVYKTSTIFVELGPILPREGEIAWQSAIKSINRKYGKRVVELNCQLCYTQKDQECWGVYGHPSYEGHKRIFETILQQFANEMN